jgi:carbonic anhydrase/acetyltransferase-like protein (isoleucine patch superfamily)
MSVKAFIFPVNNIAPSFGQNCYIAPNATIVGDVVMGNDCSIWFNAVVRGDVNSIRMGNKVNVQDGAVIHCTYENLPAGQAGTKTTIGNNVSIGHNAIVHGCTVHDNVLIGMGAIVMDGVEVGSNTIIAAGAVVLENSKLESGSIYAGVPAKKVKDISQELIHGEINRIADNYLHYASWFKDVFEIK